MRYRLDTDLKQQISQRTQNFKPRRRPDEALKHAAVALVVVPASNGEAAIILTRRSAKLSAHKGQWALPGGRLDRGETPEEAALREMSEEINLVVPPENVIGMLDDYQTRSGYLITPVVIWAGPDAAWQANPDEVASIHPVTFRELNRSDSPVFLDIPESDRPVIRLLVDESFVHAPTAAVMYQFREVCLHGRDTRVDHYEQPVFAWR